MTDLFEIPCAECSTSITFRDEDESFYCSACDSDYEFLLCPLCESVNQVSAGGRGISVVCEWCWRRTRMGPKDAATAADRRDELHERGITDVDSRNVVVGGFTLVGGSGFDVEPGATCSVLTLPDAVDIRAEIGGTGVATIQYPDLTELSVGGGAETKGGRFFGGGFGLAGAAEGMLVASVLNSLSRKTTIHTGLAICSIHGELLLHHGDLLPNDLRRWLSPLFTRYQASRREIATPKSATSNALDELERLAALRDKGVMTDEEFEAARGRAVKRLSED